jgi:hypothetical protein
MYPSVTIAATQLCFNRSTGLLIMTKQTKQTNMDKETKILLGVAAAVAAYFVFFHKKTTATPVVATGTGTATTTASTATVTATAVTPQTIDQLVANDAGAVNPCPKGQYWTYIGCGQPTPDGQGGFLPCNNYGCVPVGTVPPMAV